MRTFWLFIFMHLTLTAQLQNSDNIQLSKENIKTDLLFLFDKLEETHPNLYANVSREEVNQERERVLASIKQDFISPTEFALKVVPIVTLLKDGHTGLLFPKEEWSNYLKNDGKFFPFNFQISHNKVYVSPLIEDDNTTLPNSELLAINSIPINQILTSLRKYESSELDHFRDYRVQRNFRRLLWRIYNWSENFNLKLLHNGIEYHSALKGITLEEYRKPETKRPKKRNNKPYSYYSLEKEKIGVIEFTAMINRKGFVSFLDSTFLEIKTENIQKLIIDIRKNGGGSSQLAETLFDYITDKPYKMVDQMDIKVSPLMKQSMRKRHLKWYFYPIAYPIALFVKQARPYFYGKNGNIASLEQKRESKPKNVNNKFNGEIFLLTSANTFSSANMLANTFKCYEMGTTIGEETGGVLEAFGEVLFFDLPHSKLNVYCSSKRFIHPCYDGKLHGVIPDVIIADSPVEENDPAIEYIIENHSSNHTKH